MLYHSLTHSHSHTHIHRHRHRQTDRQTDTDRCTDRQTQTKTHTDTEVSVVIVYNIQHTWLGLVPSSDVLGLASPVSLLVDKTSSTECNNALRDCLLTCWEAVNHTVIFNMAVATGNST